VKTSNLGPDASRLADYAKDQSKLTDKETTDKLAALEAEMVAPTTTPEDASAAAEKWAIVNSFGDIESKTAAELSSAADWLEGVMTTGRNQHTIKEQSRLAEMAAQRAIIIGDKGEASPAGISRSNEREKKLGSKLDNFLTTHFSWYQTLRDVFGERSPVARRLGDLEEAFPLHAGCRAGLH
jgi:hypothetical protein